VSRSQLGEVFQAADLDQHGIEAQPAAASRARRTAIPVPASARVLVKAAPSGALAVFDDAVDARPAGQGALHGAVQALAEFFRVVDDQAGVGRGEQLEQFGSHTWKSSGSGSCPPGSG
jgi:hypothetical protein